MILPFRKSKTECAARGFPRAAHSPEMRLLRGPGNERLALQCACGMPIINQNIRIFAWRGKDVRMEARERAEEILSLAEEVVRCGAPDNYSFVLVST